MIWTMEGNARFAVNFYRGSFSPCTSAWRAHTALSLGCECCLFSEYNLYQLLPFQVRLITHSQVSRVAHSTIEKLMNLALQSLTSRRLVPGDPTALWYVPRFLHQWMGRAGGIWIWLVNLLQLILKALTLSPLFSTVQTIHTSTFLNLFLRLVKNNTHIA